MVIDFHTHAFPDHLADRAVSILAASSGLTPNLDGRTSSLSAASRLAGIKLSVILPVATKQGQHESVNRFAAEINLTTVQTGLMSFAGIHPADSSPERLLEQICQAGFRGIKLHPVYQGIDADDPRTIRLLRAAYACGLIVVMHAGLDISIPGGYQASVRHLQRMLDVLPPQNLVLAHMGGWMLWNEVDCFLGMPGLWLDTSFCLTSRDEASYLPRDSFVRLVRKHGADHVLFGTDSPWGGQKDALQAVLCSGLSQEELELVLHQNARKLLSLS